MYNFLTVGKSTPQSTLHVHPLSDIHHYQRPKAFVYEAKVTFGNALKTPGAHHWVEVLNSEIKQLLDIGTLRAVELSDVPAGASDTINQFYDKARLCTLFVEMN